MVSLCGSRAGAGEWARSERAAIPERGWRSRRCLCACSWLFPRSLGQVVNTAERGAIRLLKTDAKTGDPLAGATFAIYRVEEDGTVAEEPSDTQVSGADGIISFENLTVGDYAIRETNAPTGWLVSTDTISAKVSADGQVVDEGRVNNERIRADIIAWP